MENQAKTFVKPDEGWYSLVKEQQWALFGGRIDQPKTAKRNLVVLLFFLDSKFKNVPVG